MDEKEIIFYIFEFGAFVLFTLELLIFIILFYLLNSYLLKFKKVRQAYMMTFLGYSIRKLDKQEYKDLLLNITSSRKKVYKDGVDE